MDAADFAVAKICRTCYPRPASRRGHFRVTPPACGVRRQAAARWIKLRTMSRSLRFDPQLRDAGATPCCSEPSGPSGPISRVVGLYQTLLRRTLEQFFPDAVLDDPGRPQRHRLGRLARRELLPDHRRPRRPGAGHRMAGHPPDLPAREPRPACCPSSGGWWRPSSRPSTCGSAGLFDQDLADRLERFQYVTEDLIIADFLRPIGRYRIPAALEALRVAALSTYENRRVSTGALLLGTAHDPAEPDRENPDGAPRFNARLTAIKGFHRLCDGVRTLFLVDLQGDLVRMADIEHWADQTQGSEPPEHPCPRLYLSHAKATRGGGHVCLVLTPNQEIKVFAGGTMIVQLQRRPLAAARHPQQVRRLAARRSAVDPRRTWPSGCSRPRST